MAVYHIACSNLYYLLSSRYRALVSSSLESIAFLRANGSSLMGKGQPDDTLNYSFFFAIFRIAG